ncbi:MAG TPA: hypothetical protein QF761_03165, partial [Pirellulales bacterium]|nr:hypothetical protein [Pirellulales bacterium]
TTLNGRLAPNDRAESGALWEDLATVNITGGRLVVSADTNGLVTDSVRIEKLASASSLLLAASCADAAFAAGPLDTTLDALEDDWQQALEGDGDDPFGQPD